jgi:hypothetical protein
MSENHSLAVTYATAMFMLTLLDEWSKAERIGASAKIYNRIIQKHHNFYKQIHDVKSGKKSNYSKKCKIFVEATAQAVVAWKSVMQETKGTTISANTVIHNLYRLDAENFSRIYGLDEDIFKKLNSKQCGVTLASCRVARVLYERVGLLIENKQES